MEIEGHLVAMGGENWNNRLNIQGTKFVGTYSFSAHSWVECEGVELPMAVYRPGVVRLDEGRVMVIGGELTIQHFSTQVFIGELLDNET